MAEFVRSQKGAVVLAEKGFRYLNDKRVVRGHMWRWRCEFYREKQCRHTLYTESHVTVDSECEVIARSDVAHTHGPNPAKVEVVKLMNRVKERVTQTQEGTSTVVQTAIVGMSEAGNARVNIEAVKRTCRRQRQVVSGFAVTPASRAELRIPDEAVEVTMAQQQENVLKWDSGVGDAQRILIFSTRRHLQLLGQQREEWVADGTFDAAPMLFAQLYTIHGRVRGSVQPLVYALLPDKSQATMVRLFEQVKELTESDGPAAVMTDFEMAAMNALLQTYPGVRLSGCYFHFNQAIWRHIQQDGDVRQRYQDDEAFQIICRLLPSLAFVPTDAVEQAFELLAVYLADEYPVLNNIVDNYFEQVYIGPRHRLVGQPRRAPRFAHERWNMYERALAGMSRTNNHAEGYHRRINCTLNAANPSIWKIIEWIGNDITYRAARIDALLAGAAAEVQRGVWKERDARLMRMAQAYDPQILTPYTVITRPFSCICVVLPTTLHSENS